MLPSAEELRRELEWRRCAKDPFYFFERYWKIRHPEKGAILLTLRDAQRETLEIWLKEKQSIALKARQIGFSTLAAALAFHDIFFHGDRYIIGLSKTERESHKLKAKVDYGFARLPPWMTERGPQKTADTLGKLAFDNDSVFECLPSTDPARGESAYRIFVDEWAFFPNAEEAWAAIEPAVDIGGRVIALSTANGSGNLFHRMVMDAMTGTSDFRFIFYSWRAVPERNDAWYATKRRSMLEWMLHQEYPSSPEEAFIKSGNPVFDVDELAQIECEPPMTGYLNPLGRRAAEFVTNGDGPLSVWQPPELSMKYVIGADVAEGLEHGDFSVAHVIRIDTGTVVAKWRGHVDPDLFGSEVLAPLGYWYNSALIGPEVNNHGFTTTTALNAAGYPNLYYRHTYDERTKKKTKKLGWRTQANTKPLMIDELARALRVARDGDGAIVEPAELAVLDEATVGELRTYIRAADGKMHGSPFDDQVISLAIANQMRKHSFSVRAEVAVEQEWTLAWWERQADEYEAKDEEWLVGASSTRGHLP